MTCPKCGYSGISTITSEGWICKKCGYELVRKVHKVSRKDNSNAFVHSATGRPENPSAPAKPQTRYELDLHNEMYAIEPIIEWLKNSATRQSQSLERERKAEARAEKAEAERDELLKNFCPNCKKKITFFGLLCQDCREEKTGIKETRFACTTVSHMAKLERLEACFQKLKAAIKNLPDKYIEARKFLLDKIIELEKEDEK